MLDAEASLNVFLEQIDNYLDASKIQFSTYKEEFNFYADIPVSELKEKSRADLLDMAFTLQGYASYIQDEYNRHISVLNWCNDTMNELLAKYEKENGFPDFTKFDMKKTIMVRDNSFAQKIEELRKSSSMRVTLLEGKVFQIKRMSDILMEKSKL